MTVTLRGDDFAVEQMAKQLYRLIDVLKVQDLPESGVVEHELALIKVRATESQPGRDPAHHRALQGPRPRRRP